MERIKTYEVSREGGKVVVRSDGLLLWPERSQKVRNHSPDGFEFGYGGSGPTQLALAILLDYTDDKDIAQQYYPGFRDCFIVNVKHEGFQINASEIEEYLARAIEKSRPQKETVK